MRQARKPSGKTRRARARSKARVRVLVADDHPAVLQGVPALLTSRGLDVVADATDGQEAVRLARRQREVLRLIAAGQTTKQVASQLGISVKTAEGYRESIVEKLQVHGTAGLGRYALRTGLISAEPASSTPGFSL